MTGTAHRVLLILSAVLLAAVALMYLFVPGLLLDQLGIEADDRLLAVLRVGGSGALAEAAAVAYALRSGEKVAARLVTVMLVVHFVVESVVRVGSYVAGEIPSLVPAVPQAVLAFGLVLVLARPGNREPVGRSAHERAAG